MLHEIVDPETIPEPMTADDIESCEIAIEQFGEPLVSSIMSVKMKCRQNGLNQLSQLIDSTEVPDMTFIRASILMIQETVMDSRESIFNQTVQAWKDLHGSLSLFIDINFSYLYILFISELSQKCEDDDRKQLFSCIEKFFSRVLMRTSDNNPGIKANATKLILQLIESYEELVPLCLKERMIRNVKDAKARIDLVTIITEKALVPRWKSDSSAFRQNLMTFIVSYLKKHPHADVRNSTLGLLLLVSQNQQKEADFKAISKYLESDTIKLLQQELKKREKKKLISSTSSTVKELRALAVKSNKGSTTTKKPTTGSKNSKTSSANVTRTGSKKVTNTVDLFYDSINVILE